MDTFYDKVCNLVTGMSELDVKSEFQSILNSENYSVIYLFLSTFYFHYSITYINSIDYEIEDINEFLDVFYHYVMKRFVDTSLKATSLITNLIHEYFKIFTDCYNNTNDLYSYLHLIVDAFYDIVQDENNTDIAYYPSKDILNFLLLSKTSMIEKSILAFLHNN